MKRDRDIDRKAVLSDDKTAFSHVYPRLKYFNVKPKAHLSERTLLWKPYLFDYVYIDTDTD